MQGLQEEDLCEDSERVGERLELPWTPGGARAHVCFFWFLVFWLFVGGVLLR